MKRKRILWPFWLRLAAQLVGAYVGVSLFQHDGYWCLLSGFLGYVGGSACFDSLRARYNHERVRRDEQ